MKIRMMAALAACALLLPGALQAAEPVPVSAFAQRTKMDSPRLSPDGLHLAVSTDLGEGHHALTVYRVSDMRQTALLRLPRFEVPVQVHWVSNQRLIIGKGRTLGSREKPYLMGEIIASDFDGKNQTYVFGYQQRTRALGLEPGFGYIEGLPEQANGHFYMRRVSRGTARSQLYDIDATSTVSRLVADIPVKDLEFTLDRQGVPRFAHGTDDDNNYLLYAADEQGKNWQPVPASKMGGKFVPLVFAADGQQVFAGLSVDGGPVTLVRADADGQHRQLLASDPLASVSDLVWSATPAQPFAATIGAGKPRMQYFDANSEDARMHDMLRNSFPDQYITFVNHSADGNISLLYVYSDRDPGAWYLLERKDRKVSKLFDSREGLDAQLMGERRPFQFKASDGMELTGFMTLPAGVDEPSNLPMVLLPHGGPHGVQDDWSFDNDAQFLANRGYLVLQVNYRGSGGRGYRFEQAGYRQWGTRIQDDLLDGVRWAIKQHYADASRICVYGASFGAYSAMMSAARAPELFKCAIGSMGVYDLPMMYTKGDINETRWGMNYLGRAIGRDEATLLANSPVTVASRIQAPVLLIHGEADERAPFAQARAMKAALEAAGHPPEWMPVAKEGHGFYKDENNVAYYQRIEAFLARYLGAAQ